MTAAAAVAAAIVGTAALPAAAVGHQLGRMHHAEVYISGVRHDWQGRDYRSNRSLNKEWVDITNDSRRGMNLNGWTLSDRDGYTYTFRHVWLEGRGTVRVHTGIGRDTRNDLYQDRRYRVWDLNADTAALRDDRGRLVDSVSWDCRSHRWDMDRRDGAGWHHGHGRYRLGAGEYHHGDYHHGDYRH
ncbi:lamin tail domain-containing protein [Streptomyces sp. CA-142005]|uniref:lamin tail domain-containing protein n=1 Tax=Streptomyces sp. CA-142005 TaxID=3240052 RepID=UPI003D89B577